MLSERDFCLFLETWFACKGRSNPRFLEIPKDYNRNTKLFILVTAIGRKQGTVVLEI